MFNTECFKVTKQADVTKWSENSLIDYIGQFIL